jgi:hypothetical protein
MEDLKEKYKLSKRKIISTLVYWVLKINETTLDAMPSIIGKIQIFL